MAKKPLPLKFKSSEEIRDWRCKHQMNQAEFWSRVGVTQSGGSRYETGRNIPKPVQMLLTVTYGTDKQLEKMLEALRDWP